MKKFEKRGARSDVKRGALAEPVPKEKRRLRGMTAKQKKAADETIRLRKLLEKAKAPFLIVDRERFAARVERYIAAIKATGWSNVKNEITWARKLVDTKHKKLADESRRAAIRERQRSFATAVQSADAFDQLRRNEFEDIDFQGALSAETLDRRRGMWLALRDRQLWYGTSTPWFDRVFEQIARVDLGLEGDEIFYGPDELEKADDLRKRGLPAPDISNEKALTRLDKRMEDPAWKSDLIMYGEELGWMRTRGPNLEPTSFDPEDLEWNTWDGSPDDDVIDCSGDDF